MRAILQQSWQIYRQHFPVILAIVLVVWTPLELLSSYMDEFVFGETAKDVGKSLKFAQFLNNFFGIIGTAGVIYAGHEALTGQGATFRSALAAGISSWGRMFWTRFVSRLVIALGLILLIVPGIYLLVRLSLAEPVAMQERISGSAAMNRSFELTKGRFWLIFRVGLALLAVFILPIILILTTVFVPGLDHWLVDAATQIFADVVAAFGTVTLVTAYSHFNNEQRTVEENAA